MPVTSSQEIDFINQGTAATIGEQVFELIGSNAAAMTQIIAAEGADKLEISIKATVTCQPNGASTVRTTLGYSRKFKDEREDHVDPRQTSLSFISENEEVE